MQSNHNFIYFLNLTLFLSIASRSAKGFMHMRIQRDPDTSQYILGQFSRPFPTIPDMIRHFCLNRLPVRGAEHMCLLEPVIAQIL